jgi:hypothetical protein
VIICLATLCNLTWQPVVVSLGSSDLSTVAKLAIAGTAVAASVGSTAVLQAITHPYVTSLKYIKDQGVEAKEQGGIKFRAVRLNLFGNEVTSEFNLEEMQQVRVTQHPYANFQIRGSYYYVRHQAIEPEALQIQFAAKCNK